MTQETEEFFKNLKEEKIQKYMKVGFTREQAELLIEEIKMSGMGLGFFN